MKTLLTMFCVFCTVCALQAQTVMQAEYFIDKDKGTGKNTKFDLIEFKDSSYQLNIDVSNINEGFHKLYIRVRDSKGKWSQPVRQTIQVASSLEQPEITDGEYFYDRDPGYGKGNHIYIANQDSSVEKTFPSVTAELSTGYHKLYTRFKDSYGNWGITIRRNIEIVKTQDTVNIIKAEYFFSGDKGFRRDKSKLFATPLPDGKFKFKIPYNKIPSNADTLFLRVEDSLGNWSLTALASFSVQSFANTLIAQQEENSSVDNKKLFTIFPNPATQNINVNFSSKKANASLQIFDASGKMVLQKIIQPSITNRVDIKNLPSGIYTISVNDGESLQTGKLIKQ